ncbi:MAG: aminoacyl-tRNA hydrolase [Actinomycetota bacterium]|nr:aminoacyl-tRNA hydrolase [Actinomycetota bacterium]
MSIFRRAWRTNEAPSDRWVIVGLGNPGERYASTRHNIGVAVVDELLARAGTALKRHKSGCLVAEMTLAGSRVVLARPTSFMNESGRPVRELLRWYKVPLDRLIVVHDELDIPFGRVRVKFGGGTAGHNGLNSVGSHLASKGFLRVRVGVSRPPTRMDPADYVLSEFSPQQKKMLSEVVDEAADAVEMIIEKGPERAMNDVNTRPPDDHRREVGLPTTE